MEIIDHNILSTSRLFLRELNPSVYKSVLSSRSDDEIRNFFGLTNDKELQEEKERFHQGMTMAGKSFLLFHLLSKENAEVIGWCGFHTWYTKHRRAELGYVLNHDRFKKQGFMKEALPDVLKFGFEKMHLLRIEAMVAPYNEPSLKLMQRFGFTREGILRKHYIKETEAEDSIVFSLLREEFLSTDR